MSALAKALPAPRFGSVAQMATYTGLSPKTIRRRVEDGSIRGVKFGRRLLIPFEDIDRHLNDVTEPRPGTQEPSTMAIAPTTVSPHRSVDSTGRALPMTDAEVRARAEVAIRALDAIDDMGDEEEQRQTLEALMEAIDAEPLSDRKRFR